MRRFLCLAFVVLLFAGGCNNQNSYVQSRAKPQADFLNDISLGDTYLQVLECLSEANIQLEMPDYSETPIPDEISNATEDGREYNMTDLSFYYKVKNYRLIFPFSYEGYLVSISCRDAKIASPKGLCVGDNLDTTKKLYGNSFIENPESINLLQYKNDNDEYFNIYYENDIVIGWKYTLYQNINND